MSSKALRVIVVAGVYVAAVCGLVAFEVYAGGLGDWFALVHFGSAVPLWVACSWAAGSGRAAHRSQGSVALIARGAWGRCSQGPCLS